MVKLVVLARGTQEKPEMKGQTRRVFRVDAGRPCAVFLPFRFSQHAPKFALGSKFVLSFEADHFVFQTHHTHLILSSVASTT